MLVMYVVAMHTKAIIYGRQHHFKLFSDFFDPQSSLLSGLHRLGDSVIAQSGVRASTVCITTWSL